MVIRCIVFVAALASALPAMAFQASPMAARGALNDQAAYAERMRTRMLDAPAGPTDAVDPDQNPRRARRANAAAALINAGDCPGALALAEREHDSRLAARITLVCASTTAVSSPAQTPESPN
ncbi:hypothetical protein [Brevundimonas sp. NIBR11]|uniref:hypothetical protein n=1 Tax=Brevundimonas sp. NIBR11 TaxID=3015999 RepID=UPI0022F0B7FB|nr:hypothetical protein [Brevundimonas sp. NIBR11]WGM32600.1 hypothetical protein KKHFBJBL_02854 [Brevundimonas sp. NIBR11]